MHTTRSVSLAILVSSTLFSQAPATSSASAFDSRAKRLEFEVASIKPSAPATGPSMQVGIHIDGAQVRVTQFSMRDYLISAYDLKTYQISGPDWINSARFDVTARIPEGAKRGDVGVMLQNLLIDRFKLQAHRDSKEFPVYAMVTKDASKLKEALLDPEIDGAEGGKGATNVKASGGRGGVNVDLGRGASFSLANNRLEAKKISSTSLADMLSRFTDLPVLDATGLKSTYDITLNFSPEDFMTLMMRSAITAGVQLPPEAMRMLEHASDDSLFTAVQAVGLKLERRKMPLDVLIVDRLEKSPTEN